MNDAELEEMWKIQRDALDEEESKDLVKDDDDDEQPSTERDKIPGGQDILSNEVQESVPENQLDMNSPGNLPDEGPDSPQIPPIGTSMTPPCDASITSVDLNTSLNLQTDDPPANTSSENSTQICLSDPSLLFTSGPSQSLISSTEVVPKKGPLETSYDYLFKGDFPIEKGTSSNILAHGDQLIIQSLTQMDMVGERSPSSERTLSRFPSSVPKSPVLSSTPKWDGTPGVLNLQ
ncbi:hypothetical protein HAX54_053106 [Datura stramonium]|uniref:Uncharacterized protein n=1 Tax=Datura stramonium TaxID=4076 RepID=A0ABS8RV67_DATST|nr:hypothetical protein [Datura stramonium]